MLIVIISALIILCCLSHFVRKYNNPYLCVMVFGKKGSGKTTLLVRRMTEYHKKGYSVYTTIPEVTLPYVVHISHEDIGEYVGKPKSLLCLDEAGTYFDARKFKTFRDSVSDYFRFQRHYKNVVYLASQSFDVDKRIRSLVDKFYLCGKIGAVSYAREITRKIVLTEPVGDTESRIADKLQFVPFGWVLTWIPRYARHFNSFSPPARPYFIEPPSIRDLQRELNNQGKRKRFFGQARISRSLRHECASKEPVRTLALEVNHDGAPRPAAELRDN